VSDKFGALSIPVSTTDKVVGDPALTKIGGFIRDVLNAYADTAWRQVTPAPKTIETPVVKTLYLHDWNSFAFNENALPALFVWRARGKIEQTAEYRSDDTTFQVLWAFPSSKQEEQRARQPFINALVKIVAQKIGVGRDPAWVDAGDPDVHAQSIAGDDDALVLAAATVTSSHTISGAGLSGIVGGATMSPRRGPTVTTSVATGAFNTSAPIVFTCVDWFGSTVDRPVMLTQTNGGETIGVLEDVQSVVSILDPGQLLTTGSIRYGTAPVVGRGSVLRTRASLDRLLVGEWTPVSVAHHVYDGDQLAHERTPDQGVMISLLAREGFVPDLSTLSPNRATMSITEAGLVVDEDNLT
jgi:hypothetical protein